MCCQIRFKVGLELNGVGPHSLVQIPIRSTSRTPASPMVLNIATDGTPASTRPWGKCTRASSDHTESRCETCANDLFDRASCRRDKAATPARCSCAWDFRLTRNVACAPTSMTGGAEPSKRLSLRPGDRIPGQCNLDLRESPAQRRIWRIEPETRGRNRRHTQTRQQGEPEPIPSLHRTPRGSLNLG